MFPRVFSYLKAAILILHSNKEYQFSVFLIDTPAYIAGSVIYLTSFSSFLFCCFWLFSLCFWWFVLLFLFVPQLPTFEELSKQNLKSIILFVFSVFDFIYFVYTVIISSFLFLSIHFANYFYIF